MVHTDLAEAPFPVISDDRTFAAVAKRLKVGGRVAVDTEAASYHRYFDRIYLIQLSSDEETAIVDPVVVTKLDPLGRILADKKTEVVFHDADYDLRVLDRDYGFHAVNVFDTRIAAQFLGEPSVGLGPLLNKYFEIQVDKKFQRADWSRRPLTNEMIEYAAGDTATLLRLRDELEKQLDKMERLSWAREEFLRLEAVRWSPPVDGQGFLRVKGSKKLPPKSLAVLRAVYDWRDAKARELDRAPFRVMGNDAVLALARSAPSKKTGITRVQGVPASAVRRYGDELVEALQKGLSTPEKDYPRIERGKRPKINRTTEARLERLKTLRNRRAKALGIEPGVVCPNGTLQAIARVAPKDMEKLTGIEELRNWQIEALGQDDLFAEIRGKSADR
jgi:ribonuclease D